MRSRAFVFAGLFMFGVFLTLLLSGMINTAHAASPHEPVAPLNDADLDSTFGTAGVVTMTTSGSFMQIEALSDGRILALFSKARNTDILTDRVSVQLMRFRANGMLDNSFGKNGTVLPMDINPPSCLQSIEGPSKFWVQTDGKLLVVFECGYLARLMPKGNLDVHFGQQGFLKLLISGLYGDEPLAFAPDGKFYVGSRGSPQGAWRLTRYSYDGAIDTSFADSGTLKNCCSSFNTHASSYSIWLGGIAPLQDGRLILGHGVSVSAQGGGSYRECYADVFPANGRNPNRIFTSPNICFGGVYDGYGRLLMYGPCGFCTTRLNADGTVDLSYGVGGTISSTLGMIIELRQHDGKIICNGWSSGPCTAGTSYPPTEHIRLARVDDLGHLDTDFGNDGFFTFTMSAALLGDPTSSLRYRTKSAAVDIEFNGRIVVAGYYEVPDPCSTPFCPMTSHVYSVMLRLKGTRVPIEDHYLPLIAQTTTRAP